MKEFAMQSLFMDVPPDRFTEDNPPNWLIGREFKWWWEGYVLKLAVGAKIESDFQEITRIK